MSRVQFEWPLALAPHRAKRWFSRVRGRAATARFHRLYYEDSARTWKQTRWLGVRVKKCPLDLWIYQELLSVLRPEVVVETGTYAGGSALFLATCMDALGCGRVITIDLQARTGLPMHDRITYVIGSSVAQEVVDRVRMETADAATVMVILDSDHRREHVAEELRLYAPLVSPGSWLIVEDTNINGHPVAKDYGPGPHEAVMRFLDANPAFVRDRRCEKFLLTFNPGGYLCRGVDRTGGVALTAP